MSAPIPMYPATTPQPPATKLDAASFETGVEQLCDRLRVSVLDLSAAEREFLEKGSAGRYQLVTVRNLCAISKRSYSDADRNGLADLIRAESTGAPMPFDATQEDLFAIARDEHLTEGDTNVVTMDALVMLAQEQTPCMKLIRRVTTHIDKHIGKLYRLKGAFQARIVQ